MKSTLSFHRQKLLPDELKTSERASEGMSATELAIKANSAGQANEHSSKRTSAWPSTLHVNFMPFLPRMQWWRTGGGSIGGNGSSVQWDEIV